ncbi:50S ribosomal protein L21 [Candidatus Hydrogenedentota bacterium]
MQAVVQTGGKQYKVKKDDVLRVELLKAEPGAEVALDDVRLLLDDGEVVTEKDSLAKASVSATVVRHGRAKKILVFKSKRRKGYRRTMGHRQSFTELKIQDVVTGS